MTIKTLMNELENIASLALPDYEIFAGTKQYFEALNKTVPDKIIVIEPPLRWPVNNRLFCERIVDLEVYLGRKVAVNEIGASLTTSQYIFDTVLTDVNSFLNGFSGSTKVQVLEDVNADLYDPDLGASANNYAYIRLPLKIKISG
jgi:hypothetical protein